MYIYTLHAMPGCKAKFEGDASVQYRVRRKLTATTANRKSCTDVIRTDLSYDDATALVKRFNDKERDARSLKNKVSTHPAPNA